MRLLPIASDGWRFILPLTFLGGVFIYLDSFEWKGAGVLFLLLALFCAYFFRDFDRHTPINDQLIYSPGDGRVLAIETVSEGEYKGWRLIRIFLSVLDVHVQRTPVSGVITNVTYKKGKFLDARDPNAHFENEQNAVTIKTPKGVLVVNQIAGLIARRIVCWVKEGDQLHQGDRYGLIRFGSQVDVILPSESPILVKPGERVVSGVTVLASWESK